MSNKNYKPRIVKPDDKKFNFIRKKRDEAESEISKVENDSGFSKFENQDLKAFDAF